MRLIDADALRASFESEIGEHFCEFGGYCTVFRDAKSVIDKAPTIDQCTVALNDAPDVKAPHGYWIDRPLIKLGKLSNVPVVECSRCGITFCDVINNHHTMYRFCPYCGAKMEEPDEKKQD